MEWLANISIGWVLLAVGILGLAVLALSAVRKSSGDQYPWVARVEENVRVILGVIVAVFLVIRPLLFQSYFIPSASMEPTLMGPRVDPTEGTSSGMGDRIIADKLLYHLSDPKRGDIAVFHAPPASGSPDKEFIKRVIGLPGETIEIVRTQVLTDGRKDPGHVLVNGQRLPEPYLSESQWPEYDMAPMKLGPREYLMLGDNRNNSNDGHVWGSVPRNRFIGRAEIVFWPLNRVRIIHWWLIGALCGIYAAYLLLKKLFRPARRDSEEAVSPQATAPVGS